jgi:hypothetical protein
MRLPRTAGIFLIMIAGCASPRPVLYPNDQARRVGGLAADRDIDDCIRQAEDASGAVPSNSAAAISGLFGKPELSPGQKVLVNKCLRDKGYDPVDWN